MEYNSYTAWISDLDVLKVTLDLKPELKVCEFGLGDGTQWWLDNFGRVHSVEFVANQEHQKWFDRCFHRHSWMNSWTAKYVKCSDKLIRVDELIRSVLRTTNELELSDYIEVVEELNRAVAEAITSDHFDIAFVDPGIHLRGEIVEICLGLHVPIVIADDIVEKSIYGYGSIQPKPGYTYAEYRRVGVWVTGEYAGRL